MLSTGSRLWESDRKISNKGRRAVKSLRLLWSVIKRIDFHKVLAGFAAWFFISSFLTMLVEPGITSYGDAVWYSFVACTSIGF